MSDDFDKELESAGSPLTGKKPSNKDGKITLGADELSAIVAAAVQNAVQASSQILAEAIKDSKKPYKDPAHEENDKIMRDQMREVKSRMDESIRSSQRNCPHLQGCNDLSEVSGDRTSIVQHRLDTGEVIGICTNCQRVFRQGDEDYLKEMRRKSGNRMSMAGQRVYLGGTLHAAR